MRVRPVTIIVLAIALSALRSPVGVAADSPYACDPGAGDEIPCENRWNLTFAGGDLVYDPPEEFCDFFPCVADFGQFDGYLVQCRDLLFSRSGGTAAACTGHGGPWRPLRVPPSATSAASPSR